ncbi:hypothetical protein [Chroococcidiopsis sp. TS-821]|uniref:hypothetical protein n=1 Tax=Chroococcidiopsis sp. TS-821 TaxID=1378066 RepID=UPI000D41BCD5|nr:hypothetical protein [Chroococcidiopsis sp. TS-821]PPS44119.1 hypothetical protein B1A85_09115 [Chroococcidiopsis sp. TS-821]
MKAACLHDKDDFFWQHTTWYGLQEDTLKQVALIYTGSDLPVLWGLTVEPNLMAHLSGLARVFADDYQIQFHGLYNKMALTNHQLLADFDTSEGINLQ